jgi:hypothetical protein
MFEVWYIPSPPPPHLQWIVSRDRYCFWRPLDIISTFSVRALYSTFTCKNVAALLFKKINDRVFASYISCEISYKLNILPKKNLPMIGERIMTWHFTETTKFLLQYQSNNHPKFSKNQYRTKTSERIFSNFSKKYSSSATVPLREDCHTIKGIVKDLEAMSW